MTFVLSDSMQVNSYGFRLLLDGGDFSRFEKNPVMLYQHDQEKVVGHWESLRIEDSRLLADAVFDDDEFSAGIAHKVENGSLKGCSVGVRLIEIEHTADGTGDVATRWELIEASIVAVPSDPGALRLFDNDYNELDATEAIKQLQYLTQNIKTVMTEEEMTKQLSERDARIAELEALLSDAEQEIRTLREGEVDAVLSAAIAQGRLTENQRESMRILAMQDMESVKAFLQTVEEHAPQKNVSLRAMLQQPTAATGKEDRAQWNYLRWAKEDPEGLQLMRELHPDEFQRLLGE